jgi:hypothetical protein
MFGQQFQKEETIIFNYHYQATVLTEIHHFLLLLHRHHHWQNIPFRALTFPRRFYQPCLFRCELDHSVLNYLDFKTTISFYREMSSALRSTPNLEDQISVFMSRSKRVAQLYLQASGSLFVAFYDSGIRWRYSNPPPNGIQQKLMDFDML